MKVILLLFAAFYVTQARHVMKSFHPGFNIFFEKGDDDNDTRSMMEMLTKTFATLQDTTNKTEGDTIIQKLIDGFKFLQTMRSALIFRDISPKCYAQMEALDENLLNPGNDSWALKMVDASSKLQSGILSLNLGELGDFNQCIMTKTVHKKFGVVKGKYCLGSLHIDPTALKEFQAYLSEGVQNLFNEQLAAHNQRSVITNLGIHKNYTRVSGPTWAGCFPDGCTTEDINIMAETFIEFFADTSKFKITFTDPLCQTEDDVYPTLTFAAWITILLLVLYFFFLLSCTIHDLYYQSKGKEPLKVITAFSLYTNGKKLFKYPDNSNEDIMPCLDGLRFLSIMWVIQLHQYSITCAGPIMNASDLIAWADSWHSMFMVNGSLSVDTFFVIGSTLLMFSFLKMRKNGFKPSIKNYFLFCLHRYLRLTPALAATVLVSSTLLVYMGSGPNWPSIRLYFQESCVKYWWSSLIYLQNYLNIESMCVGHSWYLAVDMQLFLFSPFLFVFLTEWPKSVLLFLVSGVFASMAFSFATARENNLTALLSNPFGDSADYTNKYYLLTHTRAAPWFIGMIFGYLLYNAKNRKMHFKLPRKFVIYIWILSVLVLFMCILIGHDTLRQPEYDQWHNALHIAFIRPIWSLCICWVIFACVTGKGGIINWVFTLPLFTVLSRLNYCMYLIHVTMMYMMSFAKKTPVYFSDFEMNFQFWGTLFFCIAISIPWTLAFESPVIALEKIFLVPLYATSQQDSDFPQDPEEMEMGQLRCVSCSTPSNRTREDIDEGLDAVTSEYDTRSVNSFRENLPSVTSENITSPNATTVKISQVHLDTSLSASSVTSDHGKEIKEIFGRRWTSSNEFTTLGEANLQSATSTVLERSITPSKGAVILSTIEEDGLKSTNGRPKSRNIEVSPQEFYYNKPQKHSHLGNSPIVTRSPKIKSILTKSSTPSKTVLVSSAFYGNDVESQEVENKKFQHQRNIGINLDASSQLTEDWKVNGKISKIGKLDASSSILKTSLMQSDLSTKIEAKSQNYNLMGKENSLIQTVLENSSAGSINFTKESTLIVMVNGRDELDNNPPITKECEDIASRKEASSNDEKSEKSSPTIEKIDETNSAGPSKPLTKPIIPWTNLLKLTTFREPTSLSHKTSPVSTVDNKVAEKSQIAEELESIQTVPNSPSETPVPVGTAEKGASEEKRTSNLKRKLEANHDQSSSEQTSTAKKANQSKETEETNLPTKKQSPQGGGCRCRSGKKPNSQ